MNEADLMNMNQFSFGCVKSAIENIAHFTYSLMCDIVGAGRLERRNDHGKYIICKLQKLWQRI